MNNINSCKEIIDLISEIIINYITRECVKEENNKKIQCKLISIYGGEIRNE